jgi:hypothetical protein
MLFSPFVYGSFRPLISPKILKSLGKSGPSAGNACCNLKFFGDAAARFVNSS